MTPKLDQVPECNFCDIAALKRYRELNNKGSMNPLTQ
jgi:hypothetical protein